MPRLTYFPLAFLGLASLVASSTGCSAETGIVIQVTADDTVTDTLDRLEFYVAVHAPGGTGVPGDFVNDPDPSETTDFIEDRDLKADPYKLLLRRGGGDGDMSLMVVVLGYKGEERKAAGRLTDPVGFIDDKVLMWEVVLSGNNSGGVSVSPTGCLTWYEEGNRIEIASPDDRDCDGDPASSDCDDMNGSINHSATEVCDNGADDDCDDITDEETDADNDQVTNCDGDCDDSDPNVHPGKAERCDGKDNDCNGTCDDGAADPDNDRYTECGTHILDDGSCSEMMPGFIDCQPTVTAINPEAEEICDGIDNNCNQRCDENQDPDNDTFTTCGSVVDACEGIADEDKDCGPTDPNQHPGAEEKCDGVDNDCDTEYYPESVPCYAADTSNGNQCTIGVRQCGDKNGLGWAGPCAPSSGGDPGNRVQNELCTAYDNCELAGEADPFECANAAVINMVVDCTIFHGPNGEVCPNAEAVLPDISGAIQDPVCMAVIGPGAAIEHYDIRLRNLDTQNDGGTSVSSCEVVLRVHDMHMYPGFDSRIIYQDASDGAATNLKAVRKADFSPMSVGTCPTYGMNCVGLAPPSMTNP